MTILKKISSLLLGVGLVSAGLSFASDIPVEDERCNAPPFYTATTEPPNIDFVVDVSGSMGWEAYRPRDSNLATYKGEEEGYFDPAKAYQYDDDDPYNDDVGTWKVVSGDPVLPSWSGYTILTAPDDPADKCPVRTSGITDFRTGSYSFKGSCLNALFMDRVDVARWAITGGKPLGCSSTTDIDCDPELASSCDSTGCVLELNNSGVYGYVKVSPDRISGFIQSAEGLDSKPRMGAFFYDTYLKTQMVFPGDYPDGTSANATYPYTYLKRYINAMDPGSNTATKKGMDAALNLFEGDYSTATTRWKDPMYRCDADTTDCTLAGWCAKNYVILLSDGEWNSPSTDTVNDPVRTSFALHTTDLRPGLYTDHTVKVDKVYSIGLFMAGNGLNAMQHIAIFGAFNKGATQTWPTGYTNYPFTSLTKTIPTGTHSDWDADGNGVPDTFFAPQNADDLKRNLFAIFEDIASNIGAAASVATVTQNVLGEDVIVRGAFFHDPTQHGRIWEGHLESYWPNMDCLAAETSTDCATAGCTWDTAASECLPYDYENWSNDSQAFCDESVDEHCWDAFFTLPDQSASDNRNIFTYINGQKVAITIANATQLEPLLANTVDFDIDHDVDSVDTQQLITWIRAGSHTDWNYTVRDRSTDLGDIVYSAPVIVGAPSLGSVSENVAVDSCQDFEPCFAHGTATECASDGGNGCTWNSFESLCQGPPCSRWMDSTTCGNQRTCDWDGTNSVCGEKSRAEICSMDGADECFYTYQYCNAQRKKVAIVGANDGMVHAFVVSKWDTAQEKWIYDPAEDAEIGKELWAYIPSNVLSELTCLAAADYGNSGGCQHRTIVDLSPMASDVNLDSVSGSCSGEISPSSSFGDQSSCEGAGYTWSCAETSPCSGLTNEDCVTAPECTPGCETGTYDCAQVTTQAECSTTVDCSWETSCTGQYDCAAITTTGECSDAPGCSWESITGCEWVTNEYCSGAWWRNCPTYENESSCETNNCNWNSTPECSGNFDCSQLDTEGECNGKSLLCEWSSGSCINKKDHWWSIPENCDDISIEGSCILYPGNNGCVGGTKDCTGLSDTVCSAVSGCTVQPATCTGTGTCSASNCRTDLGCSQTCEGTTACTAYECTGTQTCSAIGSESSCGAAGCTWTGGTVTPWRTVLVGGQRGGGDLYFALDVTEPDNPSLLWEHSVLRNMVALQETSTGNYTAIRPYKDKDIYNELVKTQPFSWSTPSVARLDVPSDICFNAENELLYPWSATPTASNVKCWQEKDGVSNRLSGWYAFIGGGTRMYDEDNLPNCSEFTSTTTCSTAAFCAWNSSTSHCDEVTGIKKQLFQPYLLALDMGTGVNIFQYLWPALQQSFASTWPVDDIKGKNIPHSMTTPMVLDLWKGISSDSSKPLYGRDGLMDHIFVGDLAGHYWGITLDGNPGSSISPVHQPRVFIDRWQTKKAYSNCSGLGTQTTCEDSNSCWWDTAGTPSCKDGFGTRGSWQPVAASAEAALDANRNLRLYFGTGKFENVSGDQNDRNDLGKNGFYNITLPMDRFSNTDDSTCTVDQSALASSLNLAINCSSKNTVDLKVSSVGSLDIRLRDHTCTDCSGTADIWIKPPTADTTRAEYVDAGCSSSATCSCSTSCYKCIMDLVTPGEKSLNQPLVAGELVFFTTYVPQASTCGTGGDGYVYVVDYMCRKLILNPFRNSGLTYTEIRDADGNLSAVRAELGHGMPSRPVLDSKGEHILIQTSDAEIKRIKVDLKVQDYLKGWREEPAEE